MQTELDSINKKQQEIQEAKNELLILKALKGLAKDNSLACMIEINGIKFGLCNNVKIIPIINYQIKEINKFLKEEPNFWE